jgi:CDP-diacylglycerol--glycerol-3-phosphate 3-phosphatidyltransferase
MTPNQITGLRILLAFVAVALFGHGAAANAAAVLLIVGAVSLDAVDGYVARRRNLATPLGAQFDILGDRVIENLLFTYFAVAGLISLWVPVVFFVRGVFTDFVRELASRAGRTAFGAASMMQTRWGYLLVSSRASRAAYGVLKCVCFCWLGVQLTLSSAGTGAELAALAHALQPELLLATRMLVLTAVAFCLVRGLPVLWEGRRYLAALASTAPQNAGAAAR